MAVTQGQPGSRVPLRSSKRGGRKGKLGPDKEGLKCQAEELGFSLKPEELLVAVSRGQEEKGTTEDEMAGWHH